MDTVLFGCGLGALSRRFFRPPCRLSVLIDFYYALFREIPCKPVFFPRLRRPSGVVRLRFRGVGDVSGGDPVPFLLGALE
jgi:hypothetical protein